MKIVRIQDILILYAYIFAQVVLLLNKLVYPRNVVKKQIGCCRRICDGGMIVRRIRFSTLFLAWILVLTMFPTAMLQAAAGITWNLASEVSLTYGSQATLVPCDFVVPSGAFVTNFQAKTSDAYPYPDGVLTNENGETINYLLSWESDSEELTMLPGYMYERIKTGDGHFYIRVKPADWKKVQAGTTYEGSVIVQVFDSVGNELNKTVSIKAVIPGGEDPNTFTITLNSGDGEGEAISFKDNDKTRFDSKKRKSKDDYANGSLFDWAEGSEESVRMYKFDDCPETFTAPEGKEFRGWRFNNKSYLPGSCVEVNGNLDLKAI